MHHHQHCFQNSRLAVFPVEEFSAALRDSHLLDSLLGKTLLHQQVPLIKFVHVHVGRAVRSLTS